jgi:hypothetical protein
VHHPFCPLVLSFCLKPSSKAKEEPHLASFPCLGFFEKTLTFVCLGFGLILKKELEKCGGLVLVKGLVELIQSCMPLLN